MYFGKFKRDGTWGFGVFEDRFETYKEIDDDWHLAFIRKANLEQKRIDADENGNPILVDPPLPTEEEIIKQKIRDSEAYLNQTDWYLIRYYETGKAVPKNVVTKRANAREYLSEHKK